MSKKILFGDDLIEILEDYGLHKYAEDFEQYENYATIEYTFTIARHLTPTTPRIVFTIDAETDGFISGLMYTDGSKGYSTEFDSYDDVKYFIGNANWSHADLSEKRELKESGIRFGIDALEFIQNDIEQFIKDKNLNIQIVDSGLAKAMDILYIYECEGKGMKKLKSGDLYDYLFSENGLLYHNLDFGVKVGNNRITIFLPKTDDYL